jgi:hypothetical protein
MSEENQSLFDVSTAALTTVKADGAIALWSEQKKKDFVGTFKDRVRVAQYLLARTAESVLDIAERRRFVTEGQANRLRHDRTVAIDINDLCDSRQPGYERHSCGGYNKVAGRDIQELCKIAEERALHLLTNLPPLKKAVQVIDPATAKKLDKIDELKKKGQALLFFPREEPMGETVRLELTLDEWDKVIKQTDLVEVEVLQKATDGSLAKVILRKSARQIESGMTWRVFKRDGFKCRYCGNGDTQPTVDHVIAFENMGPTTDENLVTACRKCNRQKANMLYEAWIASEYYKKVSAGLDEETRELNRQLVFKLNDIALRATKRGR